MLRKLWTPLVLSLSACSPQDSREVEAVQNDLSYYRCNNPRHEDDVFSITKDGDNYHYVAIIHGRLIEQGEIRAGNVGALEQTKERLRLRVCDDSAAQQSEQRLIKQYESAAPALK